MSLDGKAGLPARRPGWIVPFCDGGAGLRYAPSVCTGLVDPFHADESIRQQSGIQRWPQQTEKACHHP